VLRRFLILAILLLPVATATGQEKKSTAERWSKEKAAAWHKDQPWLVGCNFIPSTAINQLEMWQAGTFDPNTIDRELGWAQGLGFTSVRVFLHDLPWKQDAKDFEKRIDKFLEIAEEHKIRVMFVLLDSCWHPEPKSGQQPASKPHLHNSGWVQSPGVAVLKDAEKWQPMEGYVKGVLGRFKKDRRILCWDLWNEPENNNASAYGKRDIPNKEHIVLPLVQQVFQWARAVKPSQPITSAPWIGDWSDHKRLSTINRFLFESSDIITFHRYENLQQTKKSVEHLKRYGRPILCTEYMARPANSTFAANLPYFKDENIGAYCWGFVSGKTQTIYAWDSWEKKYDAEPTVWFHDIFRRDGKAYDENEVKLIRRLTGKAVSHAK
jgi:Cellulase (glycosyl hydrolase family 5)